MPDNINDAATASVHESLHIGDGPQPVPETIVFRNGLVSILGNGYRVTKVYQTEGMKDSLMIPRGGNTFKDLEFRAQNGGSAILWTDGYHNDSTIDNCWFIGNDTEAYSIDVKVSNLTLSKCVFEMANNALKLVDPGFVNIDNLIFYNIRQHSITIINGQHINLSNVLVEAREVLPGPVAALEFYNCEGIKLTNIDFSRVYDADGHFPGALYFEDCTDIQFINVSVKDFTKSPDEAIRLVNCSGVIGSALIDGEQHTW